MRQAAHRHRSRADTASPHAAQRWAAEPLKPPAVCAPPGAPTPGPWATPAPAWRGRKGPGPGLYRRPAGSGPHAAALRRGRGGGDRVPRDDGHGAQPPQVRHGHHGGGPGPAAAPLTTAGKPTALGAACGLLGLQLQPDGEFSLQRKHQLRLVAVHHWCLNTLAPPKVVQDVILAIQGGVTQYVGPLIADDSNTARHLDHITVQVAKDRARYGFDASQDSLQESRTLGLARVPTRCQLATVALVGTLVHHRSASVRAEATRMFWEIATAHCIRPEMHYPVPEFATLAGATGSTAYPGPWLLWEGASQPYRVSQGSPRRATVPPWATSSRCAPPSCCTATRAA